MRSSLESALRNVKKVDVPDSTFAKVDDVLRNLEHRKDEYHIKPRFKRPFVIAAAIAAMLLITTTALAAWHLLTPGEVAQQLSGSTLGAAFDSDTAININATQSAGGYTFTLMSIVSGGDISDSRFYYNGELLRDRTYAVVAIQKEDGSPMTDEELSAGDYSFRIRPLVRGLKPWQVFYAGGFITNIIDGVMYVLVDSDDVSVFADRGVYLHVTTGFPGSGVISYNEETGELSPNPDFDGINILFDLPLDPSLADPVRAQEYIDAFTAGNEDALSDDVEIVVEVERSIVSDEDVTVSFEISEDVTSSFEISEDGVISKQTMTIEDYREWIKTQDEHNRPVYERYLRYFDDGDTITLYFHEDGSIAAQRN